MKLVLNAMITMSNISLVLKQLNLIICNKIHRQIIKCSVKKKKYTELL